MTMKKLFYLLLALPMFMLASCDSDSDKIPSFDVKVTFAEGTAFADGVITVEQGQPVVIENMTAINTDDKIAFGPITVNVDYAPGGGVTVAQFPITINTETIPEGTNALNMTFPVYAEHYAPCYSWVRYQLNVLPKGQTPDTPDTPGQPTDVQEGKISKSAL